MSIPTLTSVTIAIFVVKAIGQYTVTLKFAVVVFSMFLELTNVIGISYSPAPLSKVDLSMRLASSIKNRDA
jgi:hypothetical protein